MKSLLLFIFIIIHLEHFRSINFYIGHNLREAVNEGRADYIPIFNHEIPKLFYQDCIVPDVAFIHVSSPDIRGFCSLGTSVDCTRAAICKAKTIVGNIITLKLYLKIIIY